MQTTFTFSGGSTTFVRFRYNRDGNPINGVSPITTASGGSLLNKNTPGNGNTLRLRSCEDCFEARQFGSGRNGLASDPAVPGSNWPAAYTNDDTFPVPGAWFDLVYRDDPDNNRYGIIASESAGPFVNVLDSTEWQSFDLLGGLFAITNPFDFGAGNYDIESAAVFQGVLTNEEIAILLSEFAACDFTVDLACGLADINLLMAQGDLTSGVSATGKEEFDLNNNGVINETDITEWLRIAGANNGYGGGNANVPFLRGDTDGLDNTYPTPRSVDITDFQNFLNGFTGAGSTWEVGNFNGDDVVDITDFSNHFLPNFSATGGGTYGPAQSIPEPSTVLLLGLGAALLTHIFGCESGAT